MTTRRLVAILAADLAGYSRLMHADEEGTYAALTAIMSRAVELVVAQHGGRPGEEYWRRVSGRVSECDRSGSLRSAIPGNDCTSDRGGNARTAAFLSPRRLRRRTNAIAGSAHIKRTESAAAMVGINLGDVIIESHEIFGDGVNVAARLESLAEPGGILISAVVHEQVRRRIDCSFDDLGEQQVKNIATPVRAYRVRPAAANAPALALPDKPSIAVLPFQNLSPDPEQEYFADGLVEEIITALSRVRSIFVIARNSSFAYEGKSPDIRQVSRELGVR